MAAASNMSLCIPRVFPNITWQRVKAVFEDLDLGTVDRVDMVKKTTDSGEEFKRVFVHFKSWNDNETATTVRERLATGTFIKVVYDEPWFWKVSMSKIPRPNFEKTVKAPRIDLGDAPTPTPKSHKTKVPGAPKKASVSKELANMRALIAAQKEELAALRAGAPTTPTPSED